MVFHLKKSQRTLHMQPRIGTTIFVRTLQVPNTHLIAKIKKMVPYLNVVSKIPTFFPRSDRNIYKGKLTVNL